MYTHIRTYMRLRKSSCVFERPLLIDESEEHA